MIISELGHNHTGNRDLLTKMIEHSASAGATFCKIQSFFADDLSPEWKHTYDAVKKTELSWDDHAYFVRVCEMNKIIPMTSVYTTKYMNLLSFRGFKHVKIGSAQSHDKSLIATYHMAGFKVIVSTGGSDIKSLPVIRDLYGALHCVSEYPTRWESSNLTRMFDVRAHYKNARMGFSDHSPEIDSAMVAMMMGAEIIEKHFTLLDKNLTKDGPSSINISQLETLCQFDSLSLKDLHDELPGFACLRAVQDKKEIATIEKYKYRWRHDIQ